MWGTFHRRLQPLYTEKRTVSCSGFLPKTTPVQHSCSHDNAFCNLRFNKRIRKHGQALAAELRGGTDYARNDCSRTPLTQEVPFIAGCSHYTRITQGFVLWLPPQTKPMQHSCSQYNAFCGFTWQARISLRTWPQNMATIIQPLHCDLQREIQQAHRTTHTWTSTNCGTQRRKRLRSKRSKPQPLHTCEVLFIAGCSHCTRKNARFRAPASSPTKPMQHSCSHHNAFCSNTYTSMQPLQCVLQLHVTNPHYTAICNQRFKKRIALRTHEQPLIAEHGGGPIRVLLWDIKFHTTLQCDVLFCNVLLCDVLLCHVKSHTTLQCDVLSCDVLLWDVKSHTTLQCDVLLCDVKSHTTLQCNVLWCDVLLCHGNLTPPFTVMFWYVMLSDVKSHTTLHQV